MLLVASTSARLPVHVPRDSSHVHARGERHVRELREFRHGPHPRGRPAAARVRARVRGFLHDALHELRELLIHVDQVHPAFADVLRRADGARRPVRPRRRAPLLPRRLRAAAAAHLPPRRSDVRAERILHVIPNVKQTHHRERGEHRERARVHVRPHHERRARRRRARGRVVVADHLLDEPRVVGTPEYRVQEDVHARERPRRDRGAVLLYELELLPRAHRERDVLTQPRALVAGHAAVFELLDGVGDLIEMRRDPLVDLSVDGRHLHPLPSPPLRVEVLLPRRVRRGEDVPHVHDELRDDVPHLREMPRRQFPSAVRAPVPVPVSLVVRQQVRFHLADHPERFLASAERLVQGVRQREHDRERDERPADQHARDGERGDEYRLHGDEEHEVHPRGRDEREYGAEQRRERPRLRRPLAPLHVQRGFRRPHRVHALEVVVDVVPERVRVQALDLPVPRAARRGGLVVGAPRGDHRGRDVEVVARGRHRDAVRRVSRTCVTSLCHGTFVGTRTALCSEGEGGAC
eukprot:31257-Pelagococcus_subviridis.AAC.12